MNALLSLMLLTSAVRVDSKFEQVLPEPPLGKLMARSDDQVRAVVLIHGLHPHPFSADNATKPAFRDWQTSDAKLCRDLVKVGDVYAFAYAQDVPVDDVVTGSRLEDNIAALRKMGYQEIVLIGHSAGGLIARQFVEDHPDAGVTRVIQVCSPNGGSNWARLPGTVRRAQVPFLRSLTRESREKVLKERREKMIPEAVDFVCVVGTGTRGGDGIVARDSQWTSDLQKQGIPVVGLDITHVTAMRNAKAIEVITKLVTEEAPRWTEMKVAQARKDILAN